MQTITVKIIKIPFLLIWRSWFYIMIFVTVVIMSPLLFILTLRKILSNVMEIGKSLV